MVGFIVGINMREEWKAGNEGRASTDAGVGQVVSTSTYRYLNYVLKWRFDLKIEIKMQVSLSINQLINQLYDQ